VGGYFVFEEGGQQFNNICRVNLHTKKVDLSWRPFMQKLDFVDQIEVGKDKVFLSGNFQLGKTNHYFSILALDKSTAAPVSFPTTTIVKDNGYLTSHGPAIHLMGDTLFMGKLYSKTLTNGFGNLSGGISFFDTAGNLLSDSVRDGLLYDGMPDGNGGFYVAGKWGSSSGVFHIDRNKKPVEGFSQTRIHQFDVLGAHLTLGNNSLYVTSASYTQGVSLSVKGKTIRGLFKLDATTGEIDTAFSPNPNGQVYTTLLKGDTLFVGGSFSEIGGVNRTGLAAVNAHTGAVYDWDPSVDDADGFAFGFGKHHISDLSLTHDTLYAAGIFVTNSSDKDKNISSLVRYNMTTGDIDTTFHVSRTSGLNMPEFHSVVYENGKLYATGYHLDATDTRDTLLEHFAVIDTKSLEINSLPGFLFLAMKPQAFNVQGRLKVQVHNGILYLTNFMVVETSTGHLVSNITAIDLSTNKFVPLHMDPSSSVYTFAMSGGKTLLSGLFDMVKWNGSELAGIDVRTKKLIDFPTILDVQHSVCFAHNDKYLFIGSGFEKFGDSTVNGLVRLKRKDLSITYFNHRINDNNGALFVRSLALGKEGLYVTGTYNTLAVAFGNSSGAFASVAGKARQNICLLDPETAALKSWNPPHYSSHSCVAFSFGDEVVLGGDFTLMPAYERTDLAKIDLTTGKISDWNPLVEDRYAVVNALLASGDTLFVGGASIAKINGNDAGNLSAVSTQSGALLSGFAPPDFDGDVFSLYKKGSRIYAAGSFKNVNSVSHNRIVRVNTANGIAEAWDPKLEESGYPSVKDMLVADTSVYIAGGNLSVSGSSRKGFLLRVGQKSAVLNKIFTGEALGIYSLALNKSGVIAAGLGAGGGDDHFFILDQQHDTLLPVKHQPRFSYGIKKVAALGNYFLAAGNNMFEKGRSTEKPGMFVYDPVNDTVTSAFTTPVMQGEMETFAVDDKTLVFAGRFGGMNGDVHNADVAFMQSPDLQLKPGVTSWSPKMANTADPFAVKVYGSGFTQNTTVTLAKGSVLRQPNSLKIGNRQVTAYYNGKNFTEGKWEMKVDMRPGTSFDFPEALTVEKAGKANVWVDFTVPDVVRANKPATCYLSFGNRGDKAAYGTFIYIGIDSHQVLEFPDYVKHPDLPYQVDWDTVPRFVDVDYFLGEPYHGKVAVLLVPYMPSHFDFTMKLKLITNITEQSDIQVKYAIGKPLYDSYGELSPHEKSIQNIFYDAFRCVYDVVGIVADLTPGVGCIKSVFDNTVLAGVDKYMNNESVGVEDVTLSIGMIGLGCVPGGKEMSAAAEVTTTLVSKGMDYSSAFSSCKKLADSSDKKTKNMKSFYSLDPNAKYGPSGKGASAYFHTGQPYRYMVTFENDSSATASAQRVVVKDTLDENVFDLSTFKPIGFSFGDTAYFYKETDGDTVNIDLRPEKDMIVQVFYQLSPEGILTWTFLTLDPNTYQLTDDVYSGFLPPNRTAPEGEGSVLYSVQPMNGLADGTVINNSAHIIFDWNASIPTGNWHNVADNTLPESQVNSLPAVSLDKNFTVSWGGSDEASGIYAYAIYVAEGDSAYYAWLPETSETSAVFSGDAGKTYKFYSIAIDSAGNCEKAPAMYDAITQVSGTGVDNFGESHQTELRIYPNPAMGQANIGCSIPVSQYLRMDLLNGCGHFVKTIYEGNVAQGKRTIKVDISTLPAGFYFVRMNTREGIQTRKLVIQ
jgi:uncharacterized repeat protein (TIGR01451 family)